MYCAIDNEFEVWSCKTVPQSLAVMVATSVTRICFIGSTLYRTWYNCKELITQISICAISLPVSSHCVPLGLDCRRCVTISRTSSNFEARTITAVCTVNTETDIVWFSFMYLSLQILLLFLSKIFSNVNETLSRGGTKTVTCYRCGIATVSCPSVRPWRWCIVGVCVELVASESQLGNNYVVLTWTADTTVSEWFVSATTHLHSRTVK